MHRREFLGAVAGAAVSSMNAQTPSFPIVDTHIHLFDPTRPQGVPWPEKTNTVLYKPALPDRYRKIAAPLGIKAAIEVEASPWLEDNQWVLDVSAKDKIIVGLVGDLEPDKPDFRQHLDRFHKNPLFLGIRYGNLWDRNLGTVLAKPEFVAGMKLLADAGLEMDSANPTPALIADILRLSDRVPNLRVVIDHLPQMAPITEAAVKKSHQANMRELAKRPQVYVKISEVLRRIDGKVSLDLNFYRPVLDELWDIFGQDRLVYGSDWPNSDIWAPYSQALTLVRQYFEGKGPGVAEKVFWKNSIAAYRWVPREHGQPRA